MGCLSSKPEPVVATHDEAHVVEISSRPTEDDEHVNIYLEILKEPPPPALEVLVSADVYNSIESFYPKSKVRASHLNSIVYGAADGWIYRLSMGFLGAGILANRPFMVNDGDVTTLGEIALTATVSSRGSTILCQHLLASGWTPWLPVELGEFNWVPLYRVVTCQLRDDTYSAHMLQALFSRYPDALTIVGLYGKVDDKLI